MKIGECAQNPVDIRNRIRHRKGSAILVNRLQGHPADILHDDVARAALLHEVIDADNVRMFDGGKKLLLGSRRCRRSFVLRVQQTFQHYPSVKLVVLGQVYPSKSTERHRTNDFVLTGDYVALLEARDEVKGSAAFSAKALLAVLRLLAFWADAPPWWHFGVRHHDFFRLDRRQFGHLHQPQSKLAAGTAGSFGTGGASRGSAKASGSLRSSSGGAGTAAVGGPRLDRGDFVASPGNRCGSKGTSSEGAGADGLGADRRRWDVVIPRPSVRIGAARCSFQAADVAETILDDAAAPNLVTAHLNYHIVSLLLGKRSCGEPYRHVGVCKRPYADTPIRRHISSAGVPDLRKTAGTKSR